jgi:hypothetical protein
MSKEVDETKRSVLERLRKRGEEKSEQEDGNTKPTDEQIFVGIIGVEMDLTDIEAREEVRSTKSHHYDDWVFNALRDRKRGRIQSGSEEGKMEHPTTRVFRLGIKSIREGTPSEIFLTMLEEIGKRASMYDVLREIFPRDFPHVIDDLQMSAAEDRERIANQFRAQVRKNKGKQPFNKLKAKFKIDRQQDTKPSQPDTVARALKEAGMDWKSKPGPNK